jgi:hypothetical protein
MHTSQSTKHKEIWPAPTAPFSRLSLVSYKLLLRVTSSRPLACHVFGDLHGQDPVVGSDGFGVRRLERRRRSGFLLLPPVFPPSSGFGALGSSCALLYISPPPKAAIVFVGGGFVPNRGAGTGMGSGRIRDGLPWCWRRRRVGSGRRN